MILICIQNFIKCFGFIVVLYGFDLIIWLGELFFLLGLSGCGKIMLLCSIVGFYILEEGSIFFGEDEVMWLELYKWNMGMMFQSYVFWLYMNVVENVVFGLEE